MDPAGERPRSGGDIEDSSLFSNIARRFRTPPDMTKAVQVNGQLARYIINDLSAMAASAQHKRLKTPMTDKQIPLASSTFEILRRVQKTPEDRVV